MADADQSNLTTLTVDLLSAYVANNNVEHSAIPDLIKSTHAALKVIDSPEPPAPEEPEYKPAVSARQSLKSPDKIISLIDGKPYQTLKRHLKGHNLTPAEYRARYGLPKDYPMVAPAYSEARREIAKKLGLGNRGKGARATDAAPLESEAADVTAPQPAAAAPKAKKPTTPKAPRSAPAKAEVTVPAKAKSAPAAQAVTKPKAPAKAKAAPEPTPVEAPAADTPAAPTPKARKAPAAKTKAAAAPAPAKSARTKRAAKPAEPAS